MICRVVGWPCSRLACSAELVDVVCAVCEARRHNQAEPNILAMALAEALLGLYADSAVCIAPSGKHVICVDL